MRTACVIGVLFVFAVACSPPKPLGETSQSSLGSGAIDAGSGAFDAGSGSGSGSDAEEPDCFDPDICLDDYYDGMDSDETEYTTPVPPDDEYADAGVDDAGAGSGSGCEAGCGSGSDAGVSDGGVADAPADAGCTGQAEPACPMPPPGYQPRDPRIASRGLCRGACGPDCPATCVAGAGTSTCVEWQTDDCGWHAKVCTYPTLSCGSHAGCRAHDACYDGCRRGWRGIACRRACDATCIRTYGLRTCNRWRRGLGPYDSWIDYANTPSSYTYDSTCY